MLRDRVQSCGLWNPETYSVFDSVPRLQFQLRVQSRFGSRGSKMDAKFRPPFICA